MSSEFLAHMSHELRTPMNVLFGMTEMALDSEISVEHRPAHRRSAPRLKAR